ncbi:MAG TPA: hypothetical protein VGJ55_04185 [Pyrinomonadaceae bacterium]
MLNRIPYGAALALSLAVLSILFSDASPSSMPVKNPNLGTTPAPLATKTRLEVQEFSRSLRSG